MRKCKNIMRAVITCLSLTMGYALSMHAAEISEHYKCELGVLEIEAEVKCPDTPVYAGTMREVPFGAETLKTLFGDAQNWVPAPEEEDNEQYFLYKEPEVFENSIISGGIFEHGKGIYFDMELRSSEEYEAVKERMKVFDTQQAVKALGIQAQAFICMEHGDYIWYTLVGKIDDVTIAFYSPMKSVGQVCCEYGDVTGIQFRGNYEIEEKQEASLLSLAEVLEQVSRYAASGDLNPPTSGDAISTVELQYYLEEQEGSVTFHPVWAFKVPHVITEDLSMEEDGTSYFYIDAQNGELVRY